MNREIRIYTRGCKKISYHVPIDTWWRGTGAPQAARATVVVLFRVNRSIARSQADTFGNPKSWYRRFVINHRFFTNPVNFVDQKLTLSYLSSILPRVARNEIKLRHDQSLYPRSLIAKRSPLHTWTNSNDRMSHRPRRQKRSVRNDSTAPRNSKCSYLI